MVSHYYNVTDTYKGCDSTALLAELIRIGNVFRNFYPKPSWKFRDTEILLPKK